jgi:hypothetical protein
MSKDCMALKPHINENNNKTITLISTAVLGLTACTNDFEEINTNLMRL